MVQPYVRRFSVIVLIAGSIFPLAALDTLNLWADSINPGVYALDSKPYGLTYEDWTIKFWQWLLPIPSERSPMTDETGEFCGENQQDLPVFFLAFTGGGQAERTCTVPYGKAILVPINVVECSFLELPGARTEGELHVCAEEDESSNPGVFLSVDGTELKELLQYRVHSRTFDATFSDIFGTAGGPTRVVSDGYWIILEPLQTGTHTLHFKAILTNPETGVLIYSDDVKYHLTVAKE